MAKLLLKQNRNRVFISRSRMEHADLVDLLRENLSVPVHQAKAILDRAVTIAANKLKLWAISNLHIAQKFGKKTEVFQKVINNPVASAKQIAMTMMGTYIGAPVVQPAVPRNTPKMMKEPDDQMLDDLLENLKL